jgi:hypothetical protein
MRPLLLSVLPLLAASCAAQEPSREPPPVLAERPTVECLYAAKRTIIATPPERLRPYQTNDELLELLLDSARQLQHLGAC